MRLLWDISGSDPRRAIHRFHCVRIQHHIYTQPCTWWIGTASWNYWELNGPGFPSISAVATFTAFSQAPRSLSRLFFSENLLSNWFLCTSASRGLKARNNKDSMTETTRAVYTVLRLYWAYIEGCVSMPWRTICVALQRATQTTSLHKVQSKYCGKYGY